MPNYKSSHPYAGDLTHGIVVSTVIAFTGPISTQDIYNRIVEELAEWCNKNDIPYRYSSEFYGLWLSEADANYALLTLGDKVSSWNAMQVDIFKAARIANEQYGYDNAED